MPLLMGGRFSEPHGWRRYLVSGREAGAGRGLTDRQRRAGRGGCPEIIQEETLDGKMGVFVYRG